MIRRGTAVFCAALFLCISSLAGCGSSNVVVSYKEQEGNITTLTFFGNKYEPENVRSEEHTSELQSRFGISYAVFCLKKCNP